MKEKIERFSKGIFEYELPLICLSEEELRITVEAGNRYEGSFTVSNSVERPMKGVVYSSNQRMILSGSSFSGLENTISYQFNATYLSAGETIQGKITVVSDCGEKEIPFTVQTEEAYCMTSLGKVKDLFQFANLARMDWTEAKKVFRMDDFEQIFLRNDDKYKLVYRQLLKSISVSQALEEFLIAIHKKSRINLSIDKTKVAYLIQEENLMDKLILTKDHWGYAEIKVSTDATFVQLEQKFLWSDRFIGNSHLITYMIDREKLRPGKNYGRIWIKTIHQTLAVEVICQYQPDPERNTPIHRLKQKVNYDLTNLYLDFRLNRIDLKKYVNESEAILSKSPDMNEGMVGDLIRTHLAIISGKNKLAEELLGDFAENEVILRKRFIFIYCAYLYLKALYHKGDDTIRYATDTIWRTYVSGHSDWRILWFLLHTDRRYEKNVNARIHDIREQFNAGCHSPVLYYEAVCAYNEEPYLLHELNDFEIQIINYGIKKGTISKDLVRQYTYLANKRKTFHPLIYEGLVRLYQEYQSEDILSAICSILIKGYKSSEKYFEWFRLGVEAQLRITELYEYYMYSISDTMEGQISQPVLLYFIYNSNISDQKKAYLYANIIKNKDKIETIYSTYCKRIETFAMNMLAAHKINFDLAVLYREFVNKDTVTLEQAQHLPFVIFRKELSCNNPNIVAVSVIHKELGTEETIPLTDGIAQIDIYTQNYEIILTDENGNRFTDTVEYSVKPYLPSDDYEYLNTLCNHPMFLLHLYDRYQANRILNEQTIAIRKQVLEIEGLSNEYITDCYQTLLDYYYENYNDEQLEYYLEHIDLHNFNQSVRIKFIEYMMLRRFYDKALEAFDQFGYENIAVGRLVKLCSGWMSTAASDSEYSLMLSICYYVYTKGKYDEAILKYLVRFYYGPTREMFRLWQAAKSFELETYELEERLLVQMMFAESYIEDSFLVFNEYYKNVSNHNIVRAFLTFNAYKYLIHDRVISSELFPIMRRELIYEENEICLLAWLKQNTLNKALSENEIRFIDISIHHLEKRGIILPFFKEYRKLIQLPERIRNQFFIEYTTDPSKQVYIHYRLINNAGNEFITERMQEMYMGIHVKPVLLFYREILQYYITEEQEEEAFITESLHAQGDIDSLEGDESKYNQINLMLLAKEMQDDTTLLDLMEYYVRTEYMINHCFCPIGE